MKKHITLMTALACVAFASIPAAMAKPNHNGPKNELRILKQLDLTAQQKQDIKTLMQQSRADNKAIGGDKESFRAQMDTLMNMPVWDETMAAQLIAEQIAQTQQNRLNRAKAKHQIYALLSAEQQSMLQEKMANKQEKPRKGKKKMEKRMAKKLGLTEAQQTQLAQIKADTKLQLSALKETSKTFKDNQRLLIQSASFDEDAWLALDASATETMLTHRLVKTKAKYQRTAVLSDEQKLLAKKLSEKRREKMKEKMSTSGSI